MQEIWNKIVFNSMKDVRLTFNMQMSDTRDLASRITHNTFVDPGVRSAHVEYHESIVAVGWIVCYAILVG